MAGPVHGCILGTLLLAGAAQGGDSVPTGTMDLGSDRARQPVLLFHTGRHHSNGGGVHLTTPGQHIPSTTTSDTSDKGPVDLDPANFIIPPDQDPFSFLSDAVNFVRTDIGKPLNFSFEPQLIYIFQHATKSNGPHSFSYIYTNINGSLPFDDPDDAKGHLVYNVQANTGLGAATDPYPNVALGSPYFTDNIITSGRIGLKKLWWRQSFMDDTFTINIGKLYYENFFDLNLAAQNPATQFVAAQLTNSTAVPFPSYGFGFIGEVEVAPEIEIRFGTMNALSSGRASGFEHLDQGKLFSIVQARWNPQATDASAPQGNYRAYCWYSNDDVNYTSDGWGMGISFDQEVGGGLVPFLRWGIAQDGAAPATMCWSTGAVLDGFLGRTHDGIGVGCTFTDLDRSGLAGGAGWETMVEIFWRIQVTRTLQISPDLQWFSSGQDGGVEDSWIWGLRCTWNF